MIGLRRLVLAAGLLAGPAVADEPRVLALGGAVTETAFALGAGPMLVGCDLTSEYPAAAAALPKVGYVRALGAEGVLSLRPSLVLASADAGPPAAMQQVGAAQVPITTLPEAHTQAAALERVRLVGDALQRPEQAAAMMAAMRADLDQVDADLRGLKRPRVLFLLSAGRGAPMAAGGGTAAAAMLDLAGGVNAIEGFAGYRPLGAEAILLAAPDLVLTTSQTLEGAGGPEGLRAALPGLDGAVPVVAFDALFLLGFGPRLAQAQRALGVALHPGAAIRALPPRAWAG